MINMNLDTTYSEMGEGNHSLADFTINRLHEALEIANKSADDQMFQKREAEAEAERLRELLNRAIEIADEFWKNQKQAVTVWHGELANELEEIKAESQIATAPEEPISTPADLNQHNKENTPSLNDWRELGEDEVICEGDEVQPKHRVGGEWEKVRSFEIGVKAGHFIAMRYRTRRPLPKQGEIPPKLDAEIEVIDTPATYSVTEARHATADAIRCLRDEIQKIKQK